MRLSTTQIFQSGVSAMQRAQTELNHTSLQMATGRRILTPADDPSGATQSVMLQSAINKTEQYQRNADLAQPRLKQEESQIDTVQNYLQRARELVLTGSNDTYNAEDRKILATEIRQIRDSILGIANSKDANGEYLFAGTESFAEPFNTNGAGAVEYVGPDGAGAVRQVAITSTRSIQVGDTGKSLFMDIPEASGRVAEAIPAIDNQGDVKVLRSTVVDFERFEQNAEDVFLIEFTADDEYRVVDSLGNVIDDDDGSPLQGMTYTDGMDIEFAGRSVRLSGTPVAGDTITSRPAEHVSLFETLDAIATALETPTTDDATGEAFADAVEVALLNIDSSLGRMNEVRTSVGLRISALETQGDLNAQRVLDLKTTLSEVRDLDYADAISRYKQQEVVLQAAQQTYVQTSRLSLFDFL